MTPIQSSGAQQQIMTEYGKKKKVTQNLFSLFLYVILAQLESVTSYKYDTRCLTD